MDLSFTVPNGNFQAIIKCCQELKDVDLGYINEDKGLSEEDLELLAEKIPPNVEKLNLSHQDVKDDHVKILLRRCNKTLILDNWTTSRWNNFYGHFLMRYITNKKIFSS